MAMRANNGKGRKTDVIVPNLLKKHVEKMSVLWLDTMLMKTNEL
jgi:hypothetical protein